MMKAQKEPQQRSKERLLPQLAAGRRAKGVAEPSSSANRPCFFFEEGINLTVAEGSTRKNAKVRRNDF